MLKRKEVEGLGISMLALANPGFLAFLSLSNQGIFLAEKAMYLPAMDLLGRLFVTHFSKLRGAAFSHRLLFSCVFSHQGAVPFCSKFLKHSRLPVPWRGPDLVSSSTSLFSCPSPLLKGWSTGADKYLVLGPVLLSLIPISHHRVSYEVIPCSFLPRNLCLQKVAP